MENTPITPIKPSVGFNNENITLLRHWEAYLTTCGKRDNGTTDFPPAGEVQIDDESYWTWSSTSTGSGYSVVVLLTQYDLLQTIHKRLWCCTKVCITSAY